MELRFVLPLTAVLFACGGQSTPPNAACAPGQQIECACSNATKGAQTCRADGSGYDPCVCSGGTAGAGGSAGSGAAGGGAGSGGSAGAGAGSGGTAGSGSTPDAAPPRDDANGTADSSVSTDAAPRDATLDMSVDASGPDVASDVLAPPDGPTGDGGCPAALYLMIDSSGSMATFDPGQMITRWDNLSQAIPAFVDDPTHAGLMIGLDFFPEGGNTPSCVVADYAMPNVGIDVIPGAGNAQSKAIRDAVVGRMVSGGTPTTQALGGALQTAKAWQIAHPERTLGVLFMTDGQPTGCVAEGNTVAAAAMVAQTYANDTPRVRTFVVGVGPDTGPLDAIAAGGGTTKAYMVTSGGAADVLKALSTIAVAVCGP